MKTSLADVGNCRYAREAVDRLEGKWDKSFYWLRLCLGCRQQRQCAGVYRYGGGWNTDFYPAKCLFFSICQDSRSLTEKDTVREMVARETAIFSDLFIGRANSFL